MRLSFEAWLVIGIYGFYLFDSIKLLQHNRLIICRGYRGWKIICPDSSWQILRKIPYIFNPCLPNIPIFVGTLSIADETSIVDLTSTINEFIDAVNPLNYFVIILLALMCICLPLALFLYGTGLVLLTITISIYTIILAMLAVLYTKQSELSLSFKNYFSAAFDCIACPPFAINLVRKVSWQYQINLNPLEFAIKNLSKSDLSKLARVLITRMDEQLLCEDDNTVRSDIIKKYKSKLLEFS